MLLLSDWSGKMSDDKSFLSTDTNALFTPVDEISEFPGCVFERSLKLDDCSLIKLDDSQHQIDDSKVRFDDSILNHRPAAKPSDDSHSGNTSDNSENTSKPAGRDSYTGKDVYLNIEGGQEVFYHGAYVTRIPLHGESIIVGRRDVMAGHYPDVDLSLYWKQDRCLSRKHLRIYRDVNGCYFVEDLCCNNATFLNSMEHPLNKQRAELKPGDRILVSMSIVIDFCVF